jgi:hypothetical protein
MMILTRRRAHGLPLSCFSSKVRVSGNSSGGANSPFGFPEIILSPPRPICNASMEFAKARKTSAMGSMLRPTPRRGALTMSAKTNVATLAAILTALAAPAFASEQESAARLQGSGRYFGVDYTTNPQHLSGEHGSATRPTRRPTPMGWFPLDSDDFQLLGR